MKSIIKFLVHAKGSSMAVLALGGLVLFGVGALTFSAHNSSDTILNSSSNVPTTVAGTANSGSVSTSVTLPACGPQYTNHGKYVSSVAKTHPGGAVVSQAAKSSCGKPASSCQGSSTTSTSNSNTTTSSDQATTTSQDNSTTNDSGANSHVNGHSNHGVVGNSSSGSTGTSGVSPGNSSKGNGNSHSENRNPQTSQNSTSQSSTSQSTCNS